MCDKSRRLISGEQRNNKLKSQQQTSLLFRDLHVAVESLSAASPTTSI